MNPFVERKIPLKHRFSFSDLLNNLGQLVLVSILWGFCCLPVFTIGPACTALYYTVVKVIRRERSSTLEAYFHAFRENFWQSVYWNLGLLGYYAAVSLAFVLRVHAAGGFQLDGAMGAILVFAVLGAWLIPYVYPVISRFFHRGGALFRFVLYISIRHFGVTVLSLVLLAVCFYLVLLNSASLIFLPGLYALIQSFLLEPIFKTMSNDDDAFNYDEWYGDMDSETK